MTEESENTGVNESVAVTQGEHISDKEANFAAMRETMAQQKARNDELELQNRYLQQQTALYESTINERRQQEAQKLPWETISDDELLTGAHFKSSMQNGLSMMERRLQQAEERLKQETFKARHADYNEVVGLTLKEAESNPALAQAIKSSSDPYLLAYTMGKRQQDLLAERNRQAKVAEAERVIENSKKPGSVNSVHSGSAPLSKADRMLSMSDRDFEEYIARVKSGVSQ